MLTAVSSTALGGSFTPGDLVVVQLGDGSATLGNGAVSVFLTEYNISGASPVLVQSIALNSSGPSALTLPAISDHDGQLNLSENGQYLLLGGYRSDAGNVDPSTQTSALVPRVIGLIGANGSVNTTTALTDAYSQTSIRSVTSVNGQQFWTGGDNGGGATATGGTHYVANVGATTSTNISQVQMTGLANTPDNIRDVAVFNGQLYNSSGSGASVGKAVFQVGTGLPTSGMQTLTPLTNVDSITSFDFVHLGNGPAGLNTLYTSGASGINKFSLVGGTWVHDGSSLGISVINEDITVSANGSTATLFVSSAGGIYRDVDTSGFGGSMTGSFGLYLSAPTNTEFRGLSLSPTSVPEPSSVVLALSALGVLALIRVLRKKV
jgi:hypothetical protein